MTEVSSAYRVVEAAGLGEEGSEDYGGHKKYDNKGNARAVGRSVESWFRSARGVAGTRAPVG